MLIGIDGNEANIKNRVGVGRYAFELLKRFYNSQFPIPNSQLNPNFQFSIYLKNKPLNDLPKETEWWKYKVIGPKKLWTQIGLPINLFFDKPQPNVFLTPSHYAPRFCPYPSVMAIMDLSFLEYPQMFKKDDLWQLINWTKYSVKKAVKVLTISQSSKDDIIKYYGVKEEKVVVTYPGFNKEIKIINNINSIKEKYGISGEYILSVGTLQPRKNYVRLIEAFARILKQVQDDKEQVQDDNLELVIVGKRGWLYEEILEAPKKFGVEDRVRFLDYVSDEDLPELYHKASCFVLVSLYEGFGLPVLEAMSCGCPVMVSNTSSLPEVAGEAGILVNPENIEEISNKLLRLLKMSKEEREEMIRKGKEQAKKFSWEKCAKETLTVLQNINRNSRS